jgi:GTPase KRas
VFDITDAATFDEVKDARKQILRAKELDSFPMIVVGNKVDLADQRDIETSEVQKWCEEMGCPFMETSAKKRINVMESFEIVVRDHILNSSKKGKKKKSGWKFWKS